MQCVYCGQTTQFLLVTDYCVTVSKIVLLLSRLSVARLVQAHRRGFHAYGPTSYTK